MPRASEDITGSAGHHLHWQACRHSPEQRKPEKLTRPIEGDSSMKTRGTVPTAGNPVTHSPEPASQSGLLVHGCASRFRLAPLALVTTCTFTVTAWRARHDPGKLAFILGPYAALSGLLLCLHRAESLTPDSPLAERRRLHFAVWALSAALSCAFAYRVSMLMPAALVVLVWCMTSFVLLFGLYVLVLCNKDHQHYQSVDDVDCNAAGDGNNKPPIKKIMLSDEIV
jgi:hypothetical protein